MRINHAVLWPHEVFAKMFEEHNEKFREIMLGSSCTSIPEFWKQMRNHPAYAEHPLKCRDDHVQKCIPIGMHGDGVACIGVGKSWGRSADVYSWRSLLANGSSKRFNIMICLLFANILAPNEYDKFFSQTPLVAVLAVCGQMADEGLARQDAASSQSRRIISRRLLLRLMVFDGRLGASFETIQVEPCWFTEPLRGVQGKQKHHSMDRLQH